MNLPDAGYRWPGRRPVPACLAEAGYEASMRVISDAALGPVSNQQICPGLDSDWKALARTAKCASWDEAVAAIEHEPASLAKVESK